MTTAERESIDPTESAKWMGTDPPAKCVRLEIGPLVKRNPILGGPALEPKWRTGAIVPAAADATHVGIYAGGQMIYASLSPGAHDSVHEDNGFYLPDPEPSEKSEAELLADLYESIAADIRKLLALKASA